MGMDVFGNSPISERGEYFRNNIWWWHPLWEYCESVAPDIIPASNLGHFNEGWGLGREAALALADRLAQTIESGETQQFEQQFKARLQEFAPYPAPLAEQRADGQNRHRPAQAIPRVMGAKGQAAYLTQGLGMGSRWTTCASSKHFCGTAVASKSTEGSV